MRTVARIVLIITLLLAFTSSAEATLLDFIAENITWLLPQVSPDPIVLNGSLHWDTEMQGGMGGRIGGWDAWTVTGLGVWRASHWYPYYSGFWTNEAGQLVLEGFVVGPEIVPGVPAHGYSYMILDLPDGMSAASAEPGTYGVERDIMTWDSSGMGGQSVPNVVAISGQLHVVPVPEPKLLRRLLPRLPREIGGFGLGLEPRLYRTAQRSFAWGTAAVLRALQVPAWSRAEYIDLRSVTLEVTYWCAGSQIFWLLLGVAGFIAYVIPAALPWKLLVVGAAGLLALETNLLRLVLTALSFELVGPATTGWKDGIGLTTNALGLAQVVGLGRFISAKRAVG